MTADLHQTQVKKIRRETIRWFLLVTLNVARPGGMYLAAIKPVIQATYPDTTDLELKRELDYLSDRELATVKEDATRRWYADLTRYGVDVVEYTVDCDPGIARPRML